MANFIKNLWCWDKKTNPSPLIEAARSLLHNVYEDDPKIFQKNLSHYVFKQIDKVLEQAKEGAERVRMIDKIKESFDEFQRRSLLPDVSADKRAAFSQTLTEVLSKERGEQQKTEQQIIKIREVYTHFVKYKKHLVSEDKHNSSALLGKKIKAVDKILSCIAAPDVKPAYERYRDVQRLFEQKRALLETHRDKVETGYLNRIRNVFAKAAHWARLWKSTGKETTTQVSRVFNRKMAI